MKDYKTFDQQIDVLEQEHGLIINNKESVKKILSIHNYYNVINGYKDLFVYKDKHNIERFKTGTTFEEIYALYCFDREIRTVIFKYILQIENSLRTIISHTFSKYHGIENYMKYSNFDYIEYGSASRKKINDKAQHINELISNVQMDLAKATVKKDYINHYVIKHGYVPLWVLVNTISFTRLSTFYKLMKQPERIEVSKYWNVMEYDLSSYIEVLAYFRNLCAHDDRIYNAKCKKQIANTIYHDQLGVPTNAQKQYICGKNDVFAILIVAKILLPDEDFNTFYNKISGRLSSLSKKIKTISKEDVYEAMGLPEYWYLIKKI